MTTRIVSQIIESNVFVCEKDGDFVIFDAGAEVEDVKKAIENMKRKQSRSANGMAADVADKIGAKCAENSQKAGKDDGEDEGLLKNNSNFEAKGRVLGVFLTHGHYDHAFYAPSYAKAFGCKVYASEFAKEYLADAAKNYSDGKFSVRDFSDFVFLHGDGVVRLGKFEVEYFALGGHSKSDVCFRVDDDLFVGDVLIGRDMGRLDLFGGSKDEMKKSLEKLVDLKYSTMHSGHGEDTTKFSQDKVAKLWLKFLSR